MANDHTMRIVRVGPDCYAVEVTLCNGFTHAQRSDTERDARCYAAGLVDGFGLVRNAIGLGVRFDTIIVEK